MKAYAVRHKPSGLFIPRLETGRQRGGSHLEPSADREARLFFNQISARAFLSNWLRGKHEYYSEQDYEGNFDDYVRVVVQPHRKKEEMEIVEFDLVEVR